MKYIWKFTAFNWNLPGLFPLKPCFKVFYSHLALFIGSSYTWLEFLSCWPIIYTLCNFHLNKGNNILLILFLGSGIWVRWTRENGERRGRKWVWHHGSTHTFASQWSEGCYKSLSWYVYAIDCFPGRLARRKWSHILKTLEWGGIQP